jgi:histidyl-tRNA synthetase
VNRGAQAEASAIVLARQLRAAGVAVELDASGAAFGKQFKRADRSGAAWVVVIGDEEAEARSLRLKPLLDEGEEQTLSLAAPDELVAILQSGNEIRCDEQDQR